MTKLFIAAVLIITMSGCSVYRTFKAPQANVENICGDNVATTDTLQAVVPWREVFIEIPLQMLIEKALLSNSDLQIARLNIEKTEASLLSSNLAYLPSFALSPEGTVSKAKGEASLSTYNLPLTMQWELDLFGRLRNIKEQSRAAMLQSREYTDMVQSQLIASVANSYYTLILLDEQLRLTKASIENQRENLDAIIAMKEAGMQNEAAVNQSKSNYYSVQSSAKNLERQIKQTENALALLINEPPHTIVRSSINQAKGINIDYTAAIPLTALSLRPDVKYAEYALRNSFYGVNVARSAFYPSISLSGNAGWTNNLGVITNPGTLLLSALGSLTQPLFNRGLNRANLKIAEADYQQSLISFEKALLTAGSEVNDALSACQTSAEKQEFRAMQVEASREAYQNSKELMMHSSVTYLEVLVAQSSALSAELLYVANWLEGIQGEITLYKALGGGVKDYVSK